jgi:hypothetical protein
MRSEILVVVVVSSLKSVTVLRDAQVVGLYRTSSYCSEEPTSDSQRTVETAPSILLHVEVDNDTPR